MAKPKNRPPRRDADAEHRQRKEERRAQPENPLRPGREEGSPDERRPSQVLS